MHLHNAPDDLLAVNAPASSSPNADLDDDRNTLTLKLTVRQLATRTSSRCRELNMCMRDSDYLVTFLFLATVAFHSGDCLLLNAVLGGHFLSVLARCCLFGCVVMPKMVATHEFCC